MTDTVTREPAPAGRSGALATLRDIHNSVFGALDRATTGWLTPTLARLTFAGVLLVYFWASAMTKLGDGFFGWLFPDMGAYAQIFPRAMEAVTYDISQLSFWHWLVVTLGTWAEFILPLLVVLGLFTRLAALGMIGFIVVMSLTDIAGHGIDAATIGAWFDRPSDAPILDQRALWVFLLLVLVLRGAGPLSLDRFVLDRRAQA